MSGVCECDCEQEDHYEGKRKCKLCACPKYRPKETKKSLQENVQTAFDKWTSEDTLKWETVGVMTCHLTPRQMLIANARGEIVGIVNVDQLRQLAIGQVLKVDIVRPEGESEVSI